MSYQKEALQHQGLLLLEEAAAAENGWMLFACNFPKQPFILLSVELHCLALSGYSQMVI